MTVKSAISDKAGEPPRPQPPPQTAAAAAAARDTKAARHKVKPTPRSMATSLWSYVSTAIGGSSGPVPMGQLFAKTDPATDGDDCLHDCASCSIKYPRGFKVDEATDLYGGVKGWSTQLVVATGKTDWVRDVSDEKGSVMEAVKKADSPANGKLMLSASNMPTPDDTSDYSKPTTALLLPAFDLVENLHPSNVPSLIADIVNNAPTSTSPLLSRPPLTLSLPPPDESIPTLKTRPCPHNAVILMCSQKTRDARCGQSAPLLRKELERHLRPLGLYRDLHDERPGGVGIYFISHVGGHAFSANVMIYRRPNAFGQDDDTAVVSNGHANGVAKNGETKNGETKNGEAAAGDAGAAQCIWLARVRPEDCENLVRYTVLRGKVVKPESQLRGGFDRSKGLMSW